jgi:hypothetical protein
MKVPHLSLRPECSPQPFVLTLSVNPLPSDEPNFMPFKVARYLYKSNTEVETNSDV